MLAVMGTSARRWCTVPGDSESLEQCRTERHFAIPATFALGNTDPHALAVDVTDLETAKFGASHRGGIQGHEQGAVIEIACRIDQPGHFLQAEHDRQAPGSFRKRN